MAAVTIDAGRVRVGGRRHWPVKNFQFPSHHAHEDKEEDGVFLALNPCKNVSNLVKPVDDPRLLRLAETRSYDFVELSAHHRQIRRAEIVSSNEAEDEKTLESVEDDDGDELEERRKRIKEKLLQRQLEDEEEEVFSPPVEEDEEESEYETDSDDERISFARVVPPSFVVKSERETLVEREKLEAERHAIVASTKKRFEEMKIETKKILVEEIRKDQEIQNNMELRDDDGDVTDDDEVNEAHEYEAWKFRELARIKRGREDSEAILKEKKEVEKIRNMNEAERADWERNNPKPAPPPKKKIKFMQRYYHKGPFFQSYAAADPSGAYDIYNRDFSAPTGEDKMDRSKLPKVSQVKNFGRRGRTKYTHLANEDTSYLNKVWSY